MLGEIPTFIDPKAALKQAETEIIKATPAAKKLVREALEAAYPYDQGADRVAALLAAMNVASRHQQAMDNSPMEPKN